MMANPFSKHEHWLSQVQFLHAHNVMSRKLISPELFYVCDVLAGGVSTQNVWSSYVDVRSSCCLDKLKHAVVSSSLANMPAWKKMSFGPPARNPKPWPKHGFWPHLSGPDGSRHSSDQDPEDTNFENSNYCPINYPGSFVLPKADSRGVEFLHSRSV